MSLLHKVLRKKPFWASIFPGQFTNRGEIWWMARLELTAGNCDAETGVSAGLLKGFSVLVIILCFSVGVGFRVLQRRRQDFFFETLFNFKKKSPGNQGILQSKLHSSWRLSRDEGRRGVAMQYSGAFYAGFAAIFFFFSKHEI